MLIYDIIKSHLIAIHLNLKAVSVYGIKMSSISSCNWLFASLTSMWKIHQTDSAWTWRSRCNWQRKLFVRVLVLKGIYNLFVTARGYANCKINSNLLTLTAFWKWKNQRDYSNKAGGNISTRPLINSRNYPRDLLNSVFWQRRHFYSQLVAVLVEMFMSACVHRHKSSPRSIFSLKGWPITEC